jgi:bacillithiol system protein YtxJ
MIIELREKQDLEELLKRSHSEPVLLFKHSTQCSRSAGVIEDFEAFERKNPGFPCGLNLVIEHREVSDEIEDRFGIRHESPQAILVFNEKPTWHASHWKITEDSIKTAVTESNKRAQR